MELRSSLAAVGVIGLAALVVPLAALVVVGLAALVVPLAATLGIVVPLAATLEVVVLALVVLAALVVLILALAVLANCINVHGVVLRVRLLALARCHDALRRELEARQHVVHHHLPHALVVVAYDTGHLANRFSNFRWSELLHDGNSQWSCELLMALGFIPRYALFPYLELHAPRSQISRPLWRDKARQNRRMPSRKSRFVLVAKQPPRFKSIVLLDSHEDRHRTPLRAQYNQKMVKILRQLRCLRPEALFLDRIALGLGDCHELLQLS